MKQVGIGLAILLVMVLAGCGPRAEAQGGETQVVATSTPTPTRTPEPVSDGAAAGDPSTRSDNQGAVVVEITPVDLKTSGDTLVFDVSLNTHSVDLSMDLAAAATLSTDTGRSVMARSWEAPKGGHHVAGTLAFPATVEGARLLAGASKVTLTIKGLDAPERLFTWDLTP